MLIQKLSLGVCILVSLTLFSGCSREPSVEQELVVVNKKPSTETVTTGDAGQVGSSHQQEAQLAQEGEKGSPAPQAAKPAEALKPIAGFKVAKGVDQNTGHEMQFLVPEEWQSKQPTSMMRIYQVNIPPVEGDTSEGEIAFFAPIGGSIQDNIDRWIGQFSQPDGSDPKSKAVVEDIKGDKYPIKLVSVPGTMLASSMPGMPPMPEKTGYMMLGAIIETPSGPWYIKGTGPEKTMAAAKEKFLTLCRSVQIVEGAITGGLGTPGHP
ncbi:hypothetical protein HS121_10385 [bacterium]|nr:hypothetical protein [bacterium]